MAAAQQFLSTPYKLPKLWQPNLHDWNPHHCSPGDVRHAGWRKWSAEHPDWYALRASSRHPDWFNRNVNTIRRADYKNVNWHYEYPSKPTQRAQDGFISVTNEVMQKDVLRPMKHNLGHKGHIIYPDPYPHDIPTPNYGLFHPDKYEQPIRFNKCPPLRHDGIKDYPVHYYTGYGSLPSVKTQVNPYNL